MTIFTPKAYQSQRLKTLETTSRRVTLPEGRCRFVIVKDKRWDWIDPLLS